MIYYYYKNKKELFDEIITKDYLQMLKRLSMQLEMDSVLEFYTKLISNMNSLSSIDRHLYRLGIKVYMSFDGDEEHIKAMEEYENSVYTRHAELLKPHLRETSNIEAVVRTLIHLLDTLIIEIVVKGKHLPEEEIREEISLILNRHLQASALSS